MSGLFGGGGNTNQSQQAPLSSFNVQSSAYGLPVPILWGRNRIPANLIWYGDFTAVPHTQSYSAGKGGASDSSSTSYTYTASIMFGLCEGPVTSINSFWKDKNAAASLSGIFSAFGGGATQSPWSYLSSYHPTQALNYRGHAYVAAANYDLGNSAGLGNHSFDVTGALPYSGTILDANPKDVINDFLTNAIYGAGFLPSLIGDWSQFSSYCIANNLFISPLLTSQSAANSILNDWFTGLNAGIFFSEKKLKIVPYSDTSATANGVTYTPNTTPVFDFSDNDFLNLSQPVKVSRVPPSDAYNQVTVEYLDASNGFNKAVVTVQDQASVDVYGLKPKSTVQLHMVTNGTLATLIASLMLQKLLYTANTYEFTVGAKYIQLEPCDYVTLTDSRLGLDHAPVRVLSIEEDSNNQLVIIAEDAPSGVSHAASYGTQPGAGYVVNFNVSPGSVVAPAFFEVPASQALSGLAIGIAVSGNNNPNWGGCDVYVSNDGASYAYMGTVNQPARYGTITNTITNAVNQVVGVALVGNGGQILSGSTADANNDSTSCLIGSEFVDFTTSALTSANHYDLTLAVRGAHGTSPAAHTSGEAFIRVDSAIAYSDSLDLSTIGKTLHFKFLSFNIYGQAKENLASVTDYTYTVTGSMAKLPPAQVTGLTASNSANSIFLSWNVPNDVNLDRTEIWSGSVNNAPGTTGSDATLLTISAGPVGFYADYLGASGVTRYYWLRTVNKQKYPSAFTTSVTATTGAVTATPGANSITNAMIQTDAVQATQIQAGAVLAAKLAANSVTAGKIAANAITAGDGVIANLAVQTLQLAGQAVTIPISAYSASAVGVGIGGETTLQSASITSTGAPIQITFSSSVNANYTDTVVGSRLLVMRLYRDSTLMSEFNALILSLPYANPDSGTTVYGGNTPTISMRDVPGAGSFTYSLKAFTDMNVSVANRSLVLLETKK